MGRATEVHYLLPLSVSLFFFWRGRSLDTVSAHINAFENLIARELAEFKLSLSTGTVLRPLVFLYRVRTP